MTIDTEQDDQTQEHDLTGYHMSADDFRRHGRAVVDWIADYWERVESLPVSARVEPGALRAALPATAPQQGVAFEENIADLERLILPATTHWQSPSFFAYFPANISAPSVLGELLSAGLGVQGMAWATGPACTELEQLVMDWLVDAMGLPGHFKFSGPGGGVIQDSASSANLCAVLAARERTTAGASNRTGDSDDLLAYASSETHSSVEKAIRIAGIGSDNLRLVAVDDDYRMRPQRLEAMIEEDWQAGKRPFFVCATVGTTSSQAIDPLPEIGDVCRRHGLWLHVDAAMAGAAALCPEYRFVHDGLETADSYCFDAHKWLFTNFDCDCFWVRDRTALVGALGLSREYLRDPAAAGGEVTDYRDWHVPMGRRFRALKLWFVLRHYGIEGLQHHIRRHVELTAELRSMVERQADFEIVAPSPLNLLCFRHRLGDELNLRLLERLNASGRLYLSHTRLGERLCLRLCVGQTHTERRHVAAAWQEIVATARQVVEEERCGRG